MENQSQLLNRSTAQGFTVAKRINLVRKFDRILRTTRRVI
jgi:hypothetical protein